MVSLWILVLFLCGIGIPIQAQFIPTFWFTQELDHFNTQDNTTFQQRYYVYDGFWNGTGPVFFYLGAEIATDPTSLNYTSLNEWGSELGALLVSAEHRYYGESLPFGPNPTPTELGYLTVDQALEDYVQIILAVIEQYNATNLPVFSFGGSYGGLLSSASRVRYPNVYWGAYATGAPVNLNIADPSLYFNATSYAYLLQDKQAGAIIQEGFQAMVTMIQTQNGRDELQALFKLCNPLNTEEDGWNFLFWAQWGFVGPAEFNYWYPGGLYGIPYPLQHMSAILTNSTYNSSLEAVAAGVVFSWNFTGVWLNPPCFPTLNIYEMAGPTGVGLYQFTYQICSQVYIPSGSNGVTDLFYKTNQTLILEGVFQFCQDKYGVTPDLSTGRQFFCLILLPIFPILVFNRFV
eukprot:Phypoly_transcript_06729.p1 GENE.Phypoly_transcript_06729~~Phypoly_transcript_06729.p1  ORF type:complete len:404 (+),score=34.79 Phypoly_transcript_06729:63-1274(+)